MVTRNGYVKRTCCSEFENILSTGIIAAKLEDSDELIDVDVTDGTGDLVIATEAGMTIRFSESEVSEMGRSARGVNGIKLRTMIRSRRWLPLTTTTPGRCDRHGTRLREADQTRRVSHPVTLRKGPHRHQDDDRNGRVSTAKAVTDEDHLVIMSDWARSCAPRRRRVPGRSEHKGCDDMGLEGDGAGRAGGIAVRDHVSASEARQFLRIIAASAPLAIDGEKRGSG